VDRGIAPSFLDSGARRGGWSAPHPGRFTPGKDPVPFIQEAGPVWTCAKNLAPTGIRSPDCPALSQSLYRLSYLAHIVIVLYNKNPSLISDESFVKPLKTAFATVVIKLWLISD
jgi:hypothetical protein